jgi:hypothetical protein
MAKKQSISKTQFVRDYLTVHPGAMPKELVAAFAKKGIRISSAHVANIKTKITRDAAKQPAAAETPAPAAAEKPTRAGDALTIDQIKKVAHTIAAIGGYWRVAELLETIRELGGLKKFRELAEAMQVASMDDIPF